MSTKFPVLYFDGVCGLCNRTVDFVLRHDGRGQIRFAPLQGETAAANLPSEYRERLNSVVFANNGSMWTRSSAIVRLLITMGGIWVVCGSLLWCIPKPLRDLGYWIIATQRYRLFGKHETCRMPRLEERERLWP